MKGHKYRYRDRDSGHVIDVTVGSIQDPRELLPDWGSWVLVGKVNKDGQVES